MHAGQSVNLYLVGYWTAVQVSDPSVLRLSHVAGGYPATAYRATVTAVHTGMSRVTASSDDPCFHQHAYECAMPVRLFAVKVKVVR